MIVILWLCFLTICVAFLMFKGNVLEIYYKILSKKLTSEWIDKNKSRDYRSDYESYKNYLKQKREEYLKSFLKEDCFSCKTFDKNMKALYLCKVEGSCPGLDLREFDRKLLIAGRKEKA